jgi:HEAT repeat protein
MKAFSSQMQTVCVRCFLVLSILMTLSCQAQQADENGTANILEVAVSGTGQARYAAIDDLGETHEAAASVVPKLQQLLADKDPQVRWRSARALGDYGTQAESSAADLQPLLSDDNPVAQYHAAVALGKIGDRSDATVQALVSATTKADATVARAAIAALRELRPDPEFVMEALEQVLTSDDQAVVVHALDAIVERGADAVPLLNKALKQPKTAYLACAAIEHIGPDAAGTVPALVELLNSSKHSHLTIQALLALASIGPAAQSAAPQIVPLLDSASDATIPVAAAFALGSIGATDSDADLRQALTKDNPFLQMIAAWSLAKLHPDDQQLIGQAVEKLTQGLGSNDPAIRTAAAKSLKSLNAPAELVAPALIAVANDPHPEVEANVVIALASLGKSVVPHATNALQNPEMRELAIKVLTQLGPDASDAVGPLVEAIPNSDAETQAQIHFALAAIGPDAAPATDVLVEALSSDDEGVSHSALYALRQIGPGAKAARQPLLDRLEADESFEALAAAWALASIAPDDAEVAAKAKPLLKKGLMNSDPRVRSESAEALTIWGEPQDTSSLR